MRCSARGTASLPAVTVRGSNTAAPARQPSIVARAGPQGCVVSPSAGKFT